MKALMIGGASNAEKYGRVSVSLLREYMDKTMTEKISGRIIKVHKAGWGFISSKEIEFTRIFFHWTSLRQDTLQFPELKTGMIVEFTPIKVPDKGWRAVHVLVTDKREKLEEVKDAIIPNEETQIPDDLPALPQ